MPHPTTTTANVEAEQEWQQADLAERAEKAEAEAARLRTRVDDLETNLLVARLWVKELALWLDETAAHRRILTTIEATSADTSARIDVALAEAGPVAVGTFAIWVGAALAAWGLVAAAAYPIYRLVA